MNAERSLAMTFCCELDLEQRNLIKEKEQSLLYDE
jgi:hypothetical protein